ncbi:hypothetical protein F4777DRAFT_455894 [Nemania sp. FL0916]|nr:hypothetical protein F4777DRAFT_455894 [Nemania sp. FL0916]
MASAPEPIPLEEAALPANRNVRFLPPRRDCPSPGSEIDNESDASRRSSDVESVDSSQSIPDWAGRRLVTLEDDRITTAYEAWEVVCIPDKVVRDSWKSFCGIKYHTKYVNRADGAIMTHARAPYDQGELADMHEDAIRGYQHKHQHGVSQEAAYEQDLANRAHDLPFDVYDEIQHLLEDKTTTTNRNPYRKREWRIVVLEPGEFQMTEQKPERKRGLFSWKKQPPAMRTYFVVIRGQEVKSTKEYGGWKGHGRHTNPWWRLDNRETKEERTQHKDVMKKMDKVRDRRFPRPHPRPYRPRGPLPPPPPVRLPLGR